MMPSEKSRRQFRKWLSYVAILIVVVLVLGGGYWGYGTIATPHPDNGKWQAVFLANGQVYFGKLEGVNKPYATLSDIYYLQVSQPLQQPAEGANQQQPNINLIKLGDELHGPEDAMYIERSKILFWENLKDDGRVVQAISQAKK
ncbi:hypothetical protein COV04_00450 [Candidatus Uhrbacteria bacterium CG10_big_fil_rev_8_21_14_0_10_48_11]|uniref:Uncharacterized protein n=1 Tax=Candidatus Uhrbacteria bacterium CG10_big_fil_rev_8_21_14_0_10_48_11 TaxID=1975037 RepID=A0A2M8LFU7_9BACT|nr:MAG: hypothetical protein COV04_00450 [Candidatus Uhrbacteria bacterium CG10_big_fil_rev_8_21_14_0_10_48_11]